MQISASLVKELREKTGSGMMDCKKALLEAEGNMARAVEVLRKRGIASAQKRIGKTTKEGVVSSYIHPGEKLGVLVEINCETDFVARTVEFKDFVRSICMQIAAANPLVIDQNELDEETVEKEREIYKTQVRNEGKPEKILDKIVDGKMEKYYEEVCLLKQAYIKDTDKTIKSLLGELIGKLGENLVIKRFSRFRLGD